MSEHVVDPTATNWHIASIRFTAFGPQGHYHEVRGECHGCDWVGTCHRAHDDVGQAEASRKADAEVRAHTAIANRAATFARGRRVIDIGGFRHSDRASSDQIADFPHSDQAAVIDMGFCSFRSAPGGKRQRVHVGISTRRTLKRR